MTFDLESKFRRLDSYNDGVKRTTQQEVRSEFARLSLLEPTLEAYKEISARQAREIAELSTALEAVANEPKLVSLRAADYNAIGGIVAREIDSYFKNTAVVGPDGEELQV